MWVPISGREVGLSSIEPPIAAPGRFAFRSPYIATGRRGGSTPTVFHVGLRGHRISRMKQNGFCRLCCLTRVRMTDQAQTASFMTISTRSMPGA